MKSFLKRTDYLIDEAAMKEEGATLGPAPAEACDPFKESLEEHLVEVAFAEAADYEDIHKAIMLEHLRLCKAA
jgi:hypothetical protein